MRPAEPGARPGATARGGRILVAVDFSTGAQRALARAVLLAVQHHAPLTVLHVVDPGPRAPAARQAAEAALPPLVDLLVQQCRAETPPEVETRVVLGRAFVEIIAQARATDAALVVLGAHGSHALRGFFLGMTAEKVLRKGDRPVLVVQRPPRGRYRRVLVAVDFSDASGRALETARLLAPGALLSALHAYDVAAEEAPSLAGAADDEAPGDRRDGLEAARAELTAFLRTRLADDAAPVAPLVAPGRPEEVVLEVARRRRADLIVMGSRGRTDLRHLLLGSVAEHVLRQARCDVLVVRPDGAHFEMP